LSEVLRRHSVEITVRKWRREDVRVVGQHWLDFCLESARSDMKPKAAPAKAITDWLQERFRDDTSFGLIAECGGDLAGFLLARIDVCESVPPIVESRKLGIIDGVYVLERFRRYRVAATLLERAIARMQSANVLAVETTYEIGSHAAERMWKRAGFTPWMVHAYRMLYNS
jgi:GNAT superfamily N-acetyltransferase